MNIFLTANMKTFEDFVALYSEGDEARANRGRSLFSYALGNCEAEERYKIVDLLLERNPSFAHMSGDGASLLHILLGAVKLAGSWLRGLAARLAEQGPYTFSAWDLRFMLSVYADPTRADADRSGDLTVREAALLAAVLSVDGIATGLGAGPGLELAWAAVPVAVLCSLLAVVAGQCSGHLLRQKASVTPDSLGAALLVLMGLIRLAGQAT